MSRFRSLEICAGAGGQALGLEQAGFTPVMLVEIDPKACATLRANRPRWHVEQMDLTEFVGADHREVLDVDLLAGGLPSGPYTPAAGQLGSADPADLLRHAIWLTSEIQPRALLLENVPSLLTEEKFEDSRKFVMDELEHMGYAFEWKILDAQNFGVHQRRPYSVLVAMRPDDLTHFSWPEPTGGADTVGNVLWRSMGSRGWEGAAEWRHIANEVAPTIIGGSSNRGGADLGPTGSKNTWARLGVDGKSLADDVPGPDFVLRFEDAPEDRSGLPRLTVDQVAVLQGIPDDWTIIGRKTARFRQIGHALPPAMARELGDSIATALSR
ncbi:DNA (cytosine-5-)-methyltransferase [Actinomadura logoneensis]|uniref:DNA (cytosine-5-)-methyltransferase n=2 Tax=Actinomadura logoneensis TaxID=2293572 RepID=A0A372JQR6_9ACTN|nr:DNA (cytosine-5-)-methyltransferase [Actinomadura logoneensis]